MDFASHVFGFFEKLRLDVQLPPGIVAMNPYRDQAILGLCKDFYQTYYHGPQQRTWVIGINPGRFGGGITGIPFTDPVKLERDCHIPNALEKKNELSADFIYRMIAQYGGPSIFYSRFYLGAVCPLGFVLDGKNLNYYDRPDLEISVRPFIVQTLREQMDFGLNQRVCFCLGEGKNFHYLETLNKAHRFFERIVPLPHPRFIMQYRRKEVDRYIGMYVEAFHGFS